MATQSKLTPIDQLRNAVMEARAYSDRLFQIIREDSLYERPIPERHRIVFYVGHLEAFDWNLLRPGASNLPPFDADLDRLFAFGIDPVDGGLPTDQPADWPSLDQVRMYSARTRGAADAILDEGGISEQLLNTAIEHRLMHAETLAYMLHQLPLEKKIPQPQVDIPDRGQPTPEMIEVPQGSVTLGLSRNDATFGWDNEYDAHTVNVPAFTI